MADYTSDIGDVSYVSLIGLNTGNVSPPTDAYIGVNDRLQIFGASSVAGAFFTVFARVLLPDGTVSPNQWQVAPVNVRNGQNFYFDIAEGFLLSLTVSNSNANYPGTTFVRVSLIRGTPVTNSISQVLVQGYVTNFNSLCWPWTPIRASTEGRGNTRSISGTTPGPGQEIAETVPLNAMWRVSAFSFELTCSAAAATRSVQLAFSDGAFTFTIAPTGSAMNVTAGGSAYFFFADGAGLSQTGAASYVINLARDIYMQPGWRILTSTPGLQAADQYMFVRYVVEEWITG